MLKRLDRIVAKLRRRKATRERPFPQFTIRGVLFATATVAIVFSVLRVRDIPNPGSLGIATAAAVSLFIVFLVSLILQHRAVFYGGCLGTLAFTAFCPLTTGHFPYLLKFYHHFVFTLPFTATGAIMGMIVGAVLQRRRMN